MPRSSCRLRHVQKDQLSGVVARESGDVYAIAAEFEFVAVQEFVALCYRVSASSEHVWKLSRPVVILPNPEHRVECLVTDRFTWSGPIH